MIELRQSHLTSDRNRGAELAGGLLFTVCGFSVSAHERLS